MAQRYLYVIFASTPYRMGKAIRRFTGEEFNHVSLSLHKDLIPMYGFARRYYRTPFYGGFVKESLSRYHVHGEAARFRVCRLPVTQEQYDRLSRYLADMLKRQEQYLYNHLSAMAVPFRRRIKVRDAYLCAEFAVQVLHSIGIDVDPGKYYSVGALEALLRPHAIYTGPAPETELYDAVYYAPKPIPHPVLTTAAAFLALFRRLS